jgi:signal transduction histidine kinase
MRVRSLARRLTVAASLWSAVALILAALILTFLYRQTVENDFDARLDIYLHSLIGALAQQDPSQLAAPGNLGEQRFESLFSGWYWQVQDAGDGAVILASPSLFSEYLEFDQAGVPKNADGIHSGILVGPMDQALQLRARTVTFADDRPVTTMVAADTGELDRLTAAFATRVALTLAVFGFGLVFAITVQIRWGLRPLDRVRQGLADLRSGKEARFEGPFPTEISPLAKELNALLESNRKVIERARTHVGNLAHALKTPLSVILNEARAGSGSEDRKIAEQAELMRRQIDHYLDRARIAAQTGLIGAFTDVGPVVERLVRVMIHLQGDSGVTVSSQVEEGLRFRGEQQDLEEILGNLVDNACKWARSDVSISASRVAPSPDFPGAYLEIVIMDDGPGLTAQEARAVTTRGHRLDETKPGSGLGLSIVTDLVDLYQGTFRLAVAPQGGLRAEVVLPAAA